MPLYKILDRYLHTEELIVKKNLQSLKEKLIHDSMNRAKELAPYEIEEDWPLYYKTYKKGLNTTTNSIADAITQDKVIITMKLTKKHKLTESKRLLIDYPAWSTLQHYN
ncbi:hypothetical protein [Pseudolactococcus insecticola]|uniref:Uncharacterized protein n=1 Tax=Pseudolactococcus insecticola TaxID=2709158 RepID=A0A6A0BAC8_9LACT|nr:hypothetical protein [Lactococcus insecticola]GFH41408.1 hypothetical protein Hs20B_18060 [Lactococcus insecticola]